MNSRYSRITTYLLFHMQISKIINLGLPHLVIFFRFKNPVSKHYYWCPNCYYELFNNGILGSTAKPEDMYRIIEHFALGRRRLELFGEDHNIRSGWLTVGNGLSSSNFNSEVCLLLSCCQLTSLGSLTRKMRTEKSIKY